MDHSPKLHIRCALHGVGINILLSLRFPRYIAANFTGLGIAGWISALSIAQLIAHMQDDGVEVPKIFVYRKENGEMK